MTGASRSIRLMRMARTTAVTRRRREIRQPITSLMDATWSGRCRPRKPRWPRCEPVRPGKIAADEPPGSGLWILDFALEVWSGGGSFAGKPRWEDALVEAMKVQK